MLVLVPYTARTARFSKKSLGSDVGEIKKMSEKFKKKSVMMMMAMAFPTTRTTTPQLTKSKQVQEKPSLAQQTPEYC